MLLAESVTTTPVARPALSSGLIVRETLVRDILV